jgi:broad specificity phosphatase PhoE
MRYVEVFRHSKRGEGKGLSEEGRELARRAKSLLAPHYGFRVSSPKERARETMEAFGFKDYEIDEAFTTAGLREPLDAQVSKLAKERGITSLAACWEVPEALNTLRLQAETFRDALKRAGRRLPEGGRALVVSHGGVLEAAALLGRPRYDLGEIGGEIDFCEGVVFELDGEQLTSVEIKRLRRDG